MSPEEVQRTVQFLLHQQAQFAADLAALAASDARVEARIDALSVKTDQLAEGVIGLTAIVGHVVDSVSKLADAQKRTDEKVNTAIDVIERHVRDSHGHRPS
jgi:hypothetical protein